MTASLKTHSQSSRKVFPAENRRLARHSLPYGPGPNGHFASKLRVRGLYPPWAEGARVWDLFDWFDRVVQPAKRRGTKATHASVKR